MAYNLRTGLIGSGDIDVNVSLDNLNAANITAGQFPDARISDLNASKLTGLLSMDRITDDSITKAKIGEPLVAWVETEIPVLPKSKIDPTHSTTWDSADIPSLNASKINAGLFDVGLIPSLTTSQITSGPTFPLSFIPDIPTGQLLGDIASSQLSLIASDIPDLSATKIVSGTFASPDRIPALPASKITSGTFPKSQISTAEKWPVDDIPYLPATTIASGELDAARIPNLSALKIQSDTLNTDRIPNLDAGKITTGTISSDRLPSTLDIIGYKAVSANYVHGGNAIGTSWELIDSNTLMSFTVPSSRLVEIELNMLVAALTGETIYARLVNGGTSNEFATTIIADDTLTPSTDLTVVLAAGEDDANSFQVAHRWPLYFPSAQIGQSKSIDVQVKLASAGSGVSDGSCKVEFGLTGGGNESYGALIFKATALPSNAAMYVHTDDY